MICFKQYYIIQLWSNSLAIFVLYPESSGSSMMNRLWVVLFKKASNTKNEVFYKTKQYKITRFDWKKNLYCCSLWLVIFLVFFSFSLGHKDILKLKLNVFFISKTTVNNGSS